MEEVTLIANSDAKSPVSEAYRTIRTNIKFSNIAGRELKTIMLTSATPNEGKSTTVSNLAVVMAQAGHSVVLCDCDFRNPTQHKIFSLPNKGLSNCMATGSNVMDIIQHTSIPNLYVLTSGPVAPNPSELLASQNMVDIFKELKQHFDYVLIDTPPIMPVTDAAVVSGKVDGTILVIASGAVAPSVAVEAKTRLEQAGAHLLGAVLNKVDVAANSHYGYGYYYYYGHEHDGSHGGDK
ncbi:MAG: CpsD/CapB family tyrosine-protein kinase [Phascolarctobacterium sp.]|nr:CpsD/CapB family tyrosine-protein kinase [Phascolarctobacterium sp.]